MIRGLVLRFLTPLVWRWSPRRKALALQEFSFIEKDSGVQLLRCLDRVPETSQKAAMFQHVLEEFFHADLFADCARTYSQSQLEFRIPEREALIPSGSFTPRDLVNLMSYVHVGEHEINADFNLYANASPDKRLKNVFRAAAADEDEHASQTKKMLFRLCGENRLAYHGALWRAKGKRFGKQFATYGKLLGSVQLNLILTLLYFLAFPLVSVFRARLKMRNAEQLEIFLEQQKRFEGAVRP